MMITLIIGFWVPSFLGLWCRLKLLCLLKIKDAIRELQDCNFDVSIYYNQADEIGELAREMNKMIRAFKTFDDLRPIAWQLSCVNLIPCQFSQKTNFDCRCCG